MNQGFKLRYDQMRESDPASAPAEPVEAGEAYAGPDPTRNVCFVWPDGRRAFFNYAYLTSATFDPTGEKNTICLTFSGQAVHLQGYGLESLFMAFFDHLPRLVTAVEPRYAASADADKPVVVNIQVQTEEA